LFRHRISLRVLNNLFKILLHVHPLQGNVLVNKFPRRQILGKQSVARLRNKKLACVFYVDRVEKLWNNGVMQPVSKQRLGKDTSSTIETIFFLWGLCRMLIREVNAVTEISLRGGGFE
jgi:hypothetical protein